MEEGRKAKDTLVRKKIGACGRHGKVLIRPPPEAANPRPNRTDSTNTTRDWAYNTENMEQSRTRVVPNKFLSITEGAGELHSVLDAVSPLLAS